MPFVGRFHQFRIIYKSGAHFEYAYEVNLSEKQAIEIMAQIEERVSKITFDGRTIFPNRIRERRIFLTESSFPHSSQRLRELYPEGYKEDFEGEDVTREILSKISCSRKKLEESEKDKLLHIVRTSARVLFRKVPDNETDVQDKIEDLLGIKDYEYDREKVSIPYSVTFRKPDFTIDKLETAIEIKLCKEERDVSKIIDEISADITTYKTKYPTIIFIIYDIGIIRDIEKFKTGIEENNPGVNVIVIKH